MSLWTEKDGINDFVINEFTSGGCSALACEISKKTGWPMYAEYSNDNNQEIVHVWVRNNEGCAVDINGVHEINWAKTKYSKNKPQKIDFYNGYNEKK